MNKIKVIYHHLAPIFRHPFTLLPVMFWLGVEVGLRHCEHRPQNIGATDLMWGLGLFFLGYLIDVLGRLAAAEARLGDQDRRIDTISSNFKSEIDTVLREIERLDAQGKLDPRST